MFFRKWLSKQLGTALAVALLSSSLASAGPTEEAKRLIAEIHGATNPRAQKRSFDELKKLLFAHSQKYSLEAVLLEEKSRAYANEALLSQGKAREFYDLTSRYLHEKSREVRAKLDSFEKGFASANYPSDLHEMGIKNILARQDAMRALAGKASFLLESAVGTFGGEGRYTAGREKEAGSHDYRLTDPEEIARDIESAQYALGSHRRYLSTDLKSAVQLENSQSCEKLGAIPLEDLNFVRWIVGRSDPEMLKVVCLEPTEWEMNWLNLWGTKLCPVFDYQNRKLTVHFEIKRSTTNYSAKRLGQEGCSTAPSPSNPHADTQLSDLLRTEYANGLKIPPLSGVPVPPSSSLPLENRPIQPGK